MRYFDDSKATNAAATMAALQTFANSLDKVILIAGGDAKDADLMIMQTLLVKLAAVIAIGKDKERFAALRPDTFLVNSMQDAVLQAAVLAQNNSVVLLSPACSSLDMYANFAARGKDFFQAVQEI